MPNIQVDVNLYGELARYAIGSLKPGFAHLNLNVKKGTTISGLLTILKIPSKERGISFIDGNLSAMPGMQPDLNHTLANGDRIAFFDIKSMWPYQYRHGVASIPEFVNLQTNKRKS